MLLPDFVVECVVRCLWLAMNRSLLRLTCPLCVGLSLSLSQSASTIVHLVHDLPENYEDQTMRNLSSISRYIICILGVLWAVTVR